MKFTSQFGKGEIKSRENGVVEVDLPFGTVFTTPAWTEYYLEDEEQTVHYASFGPQNASRTLVMCHGFPDTWTSWKPLAESLVSDLNCRAIAFSLRGYGPSQLKSMKARYEKGNYCFKEVSNDVLRVLERENLQKVILFGHDWGSALTFDFARRFPDRVSSVCSLAVPYQPMKEYVPLKKIAELRPSWAYQHLIESRYEEISRELDQNAEKFLTVITQPPSSANYMPRLGDTSLTARFPDRVDSSTSVMKEKFPALLETYKSTGFGPALNWYRNMEINVKNAIDLPVKINQPTLMVMATDDTAFPQSMAKKMHRYVPNMQKESVNSGHWVLQEALEETHNDVFPWLRKQMRPAKL